MFNPKSDAVSYSLTELKRMKDEKLVSPKTLEALRKKADEMMAKPIVTVTRRKLKPLSGNPHDYMSMGPYWWPNPDTPNGLPYVRRDGYHNPDASDPNNFSAMLWQVKFTALAAFYFDNDEYAARAVDALYTWYINPETYMTPQAKYAQAIPGICDGRGVGLIDFRDSFEVMDSIRLLEAMGKIDPEYVKAIENWYVEFTDWMLTHENGVDEDVAGNNHGTWYDVQILASAVFTKRPKLAKKIITTAYGRRLLSQLEKNGAQPHELARTRGLGYSLMNQNAYTLIAMISEKCGDNRFWQIDEQVGDNLIKLAIDYLYPYVKNPETFPYQQISAVEPTRAAFAYYVLAERFPDSECAARRDELTTPDMLHLLTPAK